MWEQKHECTHPHKCCALREMVEEHCALLAWMIFQVALYRPQLLIQKWSPQLSRSILASWLDQLNSQGWIAREQVPEALLRATCCQILLGLFLGRICGSSRKKARNESTGDLAMRMWKRSGTLVIPSQSNQLSHGYKLRFFIAWRSQL